MPFKCHLRGSGDPAKIPQESEELIKAWYMENRIFWAVGPWCTKSHGTEVFKKEIKYGLALVVTELEAQQWDKGILIFVVRPVLKVECWKFLCLLLEVSSWKIQNDKLFLDLVVWVQAPKKRDICLTICCPVLQHVGLQLHKCSWLESPCILISELFCPLYLWSE